MLASNKCYKNRKVDQCKGTKNTAGGTAYNLIKWSGLASFPRCYLNISLEGVRGGKETAWKTSTLEGRRSLRELKAEGCPTMCRSLGGFWLNSEWNGEKPLEGSEQRRDLN